MAINSYSERFKQHGMAWLSNLLGIVLLTLTTMYAHGFYSMAAFRRVRTSSANTILVLRVLTELTSILLSINLALTLENIKWRLVTRIRGQRLPDFLGLVPGTSVIGLIQLALSKGSAWSSWRFWSLGRLTLLALLPILNVIIFSNINTRRNYHVETTVTGPYNGAMGDFNASKAANYASMIDSFIGPGFSDILSDTRRIIDITSNSKDSVPCSSGFSKTSTQTCDQTFFMPGVVVDLDLLRNAAFPQADMFVMHDTPGYMLNFTTSDHAGVFDVKEDCRAYGEKFAAFEICATGENGSLEMRLNVCINMERLQDSDCLANRDWPKPPGNSIKAQISVRNATVGFSRLNTTIQTYQLANSWSTLNISGADLLTSFDGFFGGTNSAEANDLLDLFGSFLGPPKIKYAPIFVASSIAMIRSSYGTSAIIARSTNSAQALLAIALHYCSGLFGSAIPSAETLPAAANGNYNITAILDESFSNFSEATYSLASTSYELVVSETTIWIYAVLGGLFLLINLVVLCICTFTDSEKKRPATTAFADIDHRLLTIDVPELNPWRGPRWDNVGRVGLTTYTDDDDSQ